MRHLIPVVVLVSMVACNGLADEKPPVRKSSNGKVLPVGIQAATYQVW